MGASTFVILIACFASIALADDFKTTDGKEYKNVTVSRVEPDGIVLSSKSGISKVYFAELPKEVQQRFNYERVIYFYAVDEQQRLVGVVPTRRLLTAALDTPLHGIMVQRG
jgi:Mg/Co/Ni transporter MgtE